MFCPSCGQEIPDESQFCQHCGNKISGKNGDENSSQSQNGFSFLQGLAGLLGGIVVTMFGALWFGSTQYVFPTQAAIAMWLTVIGMGITISTPVWYWLIRPISGGFNGINPIQTIHSFLENYSKSQKAVGYVVGGLILLYSSGILLRGTASAVVNREITPLSILLPLSFAALSLLIILVGVLNGISVVRNTN